MTTLALCIITRNRSEDLFATINNVLLQSRIPDEILVLDNGSNLDVIKANSEFFSNHPNINYIVGDENLGVGGGRNYLLQKTTSDFIVELDDDAIFENDQVMSTAVQHMVENPELGCCAFKITNYFSKKQIRKEYPFKSKSRPVNKPGPCYWFIGAGHIFSQKMLQEVGYYRDFFPYGSEEQDLSIRMMDKGYMVYYLPSASILHKASPQARIQGNVELGSLLLKNRLKVALYNFPWIFVITYMLVRIPFYIFKFKSLTIVKNALSDLYKDLDRIKKERNVISGSTIKKMFNYNSQLFF